MKLSIEELNDLYYCVGVVELSKNKLIKRENVEKLRDKLWKELVKENKKLDKLEKVK